MTAEPHFNNFGVSVGDVFGNWVVKGVGHERRGGVSRRVAVCRCSCGVERAVLVNTLCKGTSKGCGHDIASTRSAKHNMTGTRTYSIWRAMRQRCSNPSNTRYKDYGAKGITVCSDWKEFETFLKDMGEAPSGMSIDRIDNRQGYCKTNCRWANNTTQANNRGNNRRVRIGREVKTTSQWALSYKISKSCLLWRLNKGYSGKDLLAPAGTFNRWNSKASVK